MRKRSPAILIAILALMFTMAGCRVGTSPTAILAQTPTTFLDATAATPVKHTDAECNPSPNQPWNGHEGGPIEVQGTASSGEFWALVGGIMPTVANDGAKIIWKMSGDVGGNLYVAGQ